MKMELWIRSQDREHLMKTTDVDISVDDKTIILINNYEMAKYKTKERALEVLDEIQNKMLNGAFAKKINGLGEELDLIPKPILIYNMPEK